MLKKQLLIAINTDCDSMNAEDPIALDPDQDYAPDRNTYTSDDDDYDNQGGEDEDGSGNGGGHEE